MSYENLCKRVEKIDQKAAEYMRGEARNLPDFSDEDSLPKSFLWYQTPQGVSYWNDIDKKLEEEKYMMLEQKIQEAMKVLKISQRKLSAKLGKSENYLANINRENLSEKRKEEIIREIDCLLNGGEVKSDTQIIAELSQQVAELQDTNHELRTLYQKERQKVADQSEVTISGIQDLRRTIQDSREIMDELQKKELESKRTAKAFCKFKRATWTLIVVVLFLLCVLGLWLVV